jgi:hypothetical protein
MTEPLPAALLLVALAAAGCVSGPGAAAGDAGAEARPPPGGVLFALDAATQHCDDAATFMVGPALSDSGPCTSSRSVSFLVDVAPILAARCSGEVCHQATWGGQGAYDTLVGVRTSECCDARKRVLPGDPARSYVIQKLRGTDLCGGRPMPLSGIITEAEISTLEAWICAGAPRN